MVNQKKCDYEPLHTGHYLIGHGDSKEIRRSLACLCFEEYDYWVEKGADPIYEDADIFLHGSCHIFASELNRKYNYDVFQLTDGEGRGIHWFCQTIFQGKKIYVDVRGMTDFFEELFSEFEVYAGKDYTISPCDIEGELGSDDELSEQAARIFSQEIIDAHPEYYNIELLCEL